MNGANGVSVVVVSGDITKVKVDALITTLNSRGLWIDRIDNAICRAAGNFFHDQAAHIGPLKDGQMIIARSNGVQHEGAFRDVLFVVDDLKRPLREVIESSLFFAARAGFQTVSLPGIRTGFTLGFAEKNRKEVVEEVLTGVRRFLDKNLNASLTDITFVIKDDSETLLMLQKVLK